MPRREDPDQDDQQQCPRCVGTGTWWNPRTALTTPCVACRGTGTVTLRRREALLRSQAASTAYAEDINTRTDGPSTR